MQAIAIENLGVIGMGEDLNPNAGIRQFGFEYDYGKGKAGNI
jgi:hypothetical protein